MFSKLIFYALLSITTIIIASQQNESKWFTNRTFKTGGQLRNGATLLIIKCYCLKALPEDFSPELDFEQNEQGSLFAVYKQKKQLLGTWPNQKLNTQEATTAWFYGEIPNVEIQIPYRNISKNPTS